MVPVLGLWRVQRGPLTAPSQPQLVLPLLGQGQQRRRRPQQAGPRRHFHRCRCHRQSSSAAHASCPAGRLARCLSALPHCKCLTGVPPQHEAVHAARDKHEPGGAAWYMRSMKRTWGTVAGATLRFTPCDVDTTSLMVSCMRANPERCSCSAEVPIVDSLMPLSTPPSEACLQRRGVVWMLRTLHHTSGLGKAPTCRTASTSTSAREVRSAALASALMWRSATFSSSRSWASACHSAGGDGLQLKHNHPRGSAARGEAKQVGNGYTVRHAVQGSPDHPQQCLQSAGVLQPRTFQLLVRIDMPHAPPAEVPARIRVLADGRPGAGTQQGAKTALAAAQPQNKVQRSV